MVSQPEIRKHDAWAHQVEAYHACLGRQASLLGLEMGCGKTKVALDLVANEGWGRVLILCPKSVLGVWKREVSRHWPADRIDAEVYLLDRHTSKEKAEELKSFLSYCQASVKIVVVNYDTAWREPLAKAILGAGFTCAVLDESHRIKSPSGKASRFAQALGKVVRRRLCLTGTPMPHSPLDLYGQFRFLDPGVFGTSFARFRARYAITHSQFPSKVLKFINQDDLNAKLFSVAHVCKAADVLDLPPISQETRTTPLSSKSARVYRDLEKDLISLVDAGTVTVANALTKLLRLQQVTSGFVSGKGDDEETFVQELGNEKESLLADLLEDVAAPAVVFCRFQRDLDAVKRVAEKLKRKFGELSGRRRDLTDHAEMLPDVEVMAVQIQAGGVGIDLTRASYAFYYSLGYSLGEFLQSIARVHRPGQTRPVHIYHLVAEGTVDELVYKALDKRAEVVESVLQSLKGKA